MALIAFRILPLRTINMHWLYLLETIRGCKSNMQIEAGMETQETANLSKKLNAGRIQRVRQIEAFLITFVMFSSWKIKTDTKCRYKELQVHG